MVKEMSPSIFWRITDFFKIRIGISIDIQDSWNGVLNRNVLDDIVVDIFHMVVPAASRTRMQGGVSECVHLVQLVRLLKTTNLL